MAESTSEASAAASATALQTSVPVQIASDLHLEFFASKLDEAGREAKFSELIKPAAPILALLGDIGVLGTPTTASGQDDSPARRIWIAFISWCCSQFERVLIVLGNHEFYTTSEQKVTFDEIKAFVRHTIESRGDDKLVLLDDSAVVCRGLRIVGSTLWTHMPPHALLETAKAESPEYLVNDYRRIMHVSAPKEHSEAGASTTPVIKCITAAHTNAWHRAGVTAIESAAAAADAAGECLLVLTHHAPSFRGTSQPPPPPCDDAELLADACDRPPKPYHPLIRFAVATDLEGLIARHPSIRVWCFGHTHHCSDQCIASARVLSNQRGYERDETAYDPSFVVRVPVRLDDAGIVEAKNDTDEADDGGGGEGGDGGDKGEGGDGGDKGEGVAMWKRFVTKDGRPYYFREDTGERVWTLPGTQSTKHAESKKRCILL